MIGRLRTRFRDRYGYPFNAPTIERNSYPNDRSVETKFEWTLLYRRIEISYSRPIRRHEAAGTTAEAYFEDADA